MDRTKLIKRNIIAIDMKSFFALCECVERGLDPFTTPLVVAEPNRNGAMTLAVTPYMKSLGVASRSRIYEISPKIIFDPILNKIETPILPKRIKGTI